MRRKNLPADLPAASDYRGRSVPSNVSPNQWLKDIDECQRQLMDASKAITRKAKLENRDLLASEARSHDAITDELEAFVEVRKEFQDEFEETRQLGMAGPSPDFPDMGDMSEDDRNSRDWSSEPLRNPGSPVPHGGWGHDTSTEDGVPLGKRSMVSWVRSRTDVDLPTDYSNLSLRKYIRGITTGDWARADGERRAMAEGTMAAGGFMVPTILSSQIIDLARNKARVLQAGAKTIPMGSKELNVPKWSGDPTAKFRAENAEITQSDATIGSVKLEAKSLAALTVVSRELVEDAPGIESELQEAFAAQIALSIDHAALYGSGTGAEPQGVKGAPGVGTTALGAAPANYDWLIDALGELEDQNETPNGVILAPRTQRQLSKLTDNTGQPLVAPQAVLDVPRYSTNQVQVDQGTGTNESDVFAADWSQLYLGMRTQISVQVLTERYADYGQLGFLVWWRGDIAVARPNAFHVVTGVTDV